MSSSLLVQPTVNVGIVGHVDHGKTTLTKLFSGKWTDTHSEEVKRGITIKLGYTNFIVYKDKEKFSVSSGEPIRKFSIVDAPGHESFMATMISGAAVMDYALLVVAADEKCPQPQTIEHLKTLEIAGIKKIIVVQNKIDNVSKEDALKNYKEIVDFLDKTTYKDSKIIPISAQHSANLSSLLKEIVETFDEPQRNLEKTPLMNIVRSFDVNKPGSSYDILKGGILGGSVKQGVFKVDDEIEIKPGIMEQKEGKVTYQTIYAKILALKSDKDSIESAVPGGSIAIMTGLDPFLTKADTLVGQIAGSKGTLPEPTSEIVFSINLFDKIVTSTKEYEVKPIILNEAFMLIVNSMTTVGIITKANPKEATIKLKRPVMAFDGDRAVLFRRFEGNKWRSIGYGVVKV